MNYRVLFGILVLLSPTVAQVPPQAGATAVQFISRGDTASVSWTDGGISVSLYVARCGPINESGTCLSYNIVVLPPPPPPGFPPPLPITLEAGGGNIPNSDFTGTFESGALTLNTDTSAAANPGFQRIAGAGGLIQIQFQRTADFWTKNTGTLESHTQYQTIHSTGNATNVSAKAAGRVLVWSTPVLYPAFATIGKNDSVQVTITRTK